MVASAFLPELWTEILIPVCAVVGIAFSLFQWFIVSRVRVSADQGASSSSSGGSKNGYGDYLIEEEEGVNDQSVVAKCAEIQTAISEGATSFLFTEYRYVGVFMVIFAAIIFVFLGSVEGFSTENKPCTYDETKTCKPALATAAFSTIAFVLGAVTSVLSGFLGMKIATYANARTTLEARKGVGKAFIVAFRSGAVMGFLLAASGLLVLYVTINVFKIYYGDDWEGLFEAITGYGLGGSSMALFGRVGGGIYTKAADVGADLVGKIERNIPEDDPRNPAVIADNVGDNVGDIAGMGSDLFGSYAEASCAALVVASISSFGINHDFTAMCYPLLISSMGILVCLITTLFATDFFEIKAVKEIEPALKNQLIISTVIMTVGIAVVSWVGLPSSFTIFNFGTQKVVQNWQLFLCVCASILLDSTKDNTAEKDSPANLSLRGYEIIDDAKKKIEATCPGVVSCADIIAMAARDAVFSANGPYYQIPKGRFDGKRSKIEDTRNLPSPFLNASQLIQTFGQRGFTPQDVVALSGAHTLGVARCSSFKARLTTPDSSMDSSFVNTLTKTCSAGDNAEQPFDATRNNFDNAYFNALQRKSGVLFSDQTLFNTPATRNIVNGYAFNQAKFFFDFQMAMQKMSNLDVKLGSQGDVRKNCRILN